jgi:signal transduction histidine kinase
MRAAVDLRRHGWVGLGFAAVLAGLVGALILASPVPMPGGGYFAPNADLLGPLVPLVASVLAVGGVLLAARAPGLASLVVAAPFLLLPWTQAFVFGWFAALVAVTLVAVVRGWRHAIVPWLVTVVVAAVYCGTEAVAYLPIGGVTSGSGPEFELVVWGLYVLWITGLTALTGAVMARRRAQEVEQRAHGQEERALVTDTIARERARMARDLHDVVAHHVSLIAVRAESAPFQYPELGDDARGVLADVAADARSALGELREALAILQRTDDERTDDERADDEHDEVPGAGRRPQPTAADLSALVEEAQRAGQQVRVSGEWTDVPDGTGYVLYRATQEALTNARRHAPGSAVDVQRTQRPGEVGVRVSNASTGGVRAVRRGRGLVGMQERVDALGGTLLVGPTPDAFVVEVRLPDEVRA